MDNGTQKASLENMQKRSELYQTISYDEFEALDQSVAKTVLTKHQ